jgi:hypothetical protein
MNSLFNLEEVGLQDQPRVGEEAANLGELLRVGAPVTPAFVVPTTAYAEYLNCPPVEKVLGVHTPFDMGRFESQLLSVPLPKILDQSLRAAYRELSGSRDTFVSVRAGKTGLRALGGEELVYAVKKLWAGHLAQLHLSEEKLSLAPLPILVQQLEQRELEGELLTSDPHTSDTRIAVVEVAHSDGREKLFFRKAPGSGMSGEPNQLVKRLAAGAVSESAPSEFVSSLSSWAVKIERALGGPQQLGWGSFRNVFGFSWIRPLYLRKRVPGAAKLWVRVDNSDRAVPAEAFGLIASSAERAASLARDFPSKTTLLELSAVNEDELSVFRRAKYKENLSNLHLILPPVRTVDGLRQLKKVISGEGLTRGYRLKFYFRLFFPANVVLFEKFAELGVDGVVFDSQYLAQGFLGTQESVKADDSVLWALNVVRQHCQEADLDLLFRSNNPEEDLIADVMGKGITQIVIDISDEKALLKVLSSTEERLLEE